MKSFNLVEYSKNPSRKVVTRDGLNARIVCTDRKDSKYPIVALIESKSGGEFLQYYTKNGTCYVDCLCDADLLFPSEKHEGWVNIYKGNKWFTSSAIWPTEEEAKKLAWSGCIATIKIEWEE